MTSTAASVLLARCPSRGSVRVERLFVAFGFSGTGFKTAPAVGASMAELILTGTSTTIDQTPFGFERS